MKYCAVIPARYQSTRFPGKPLANILGKPMIWWVYHKVRNVEEFDKVIVATDSDKIVNVLKEYDIEYIMTASHHENHINRLHEVSQKVESEYYICINGDEPMIESRTIQKILEPLKKGYKPYALNLITTIKDATQAIDFAKIKIAINKDNNIIYMSRSAIPYPRGTSKYELKKYVGVECFSLEALSFFQNTKMGCLEEIEDIDHLRFIENHKKIKAIEVESETLSVDTLKDLEKVIFLMKSEKKRR